MSAAEFRGALRDDGCGPASFVTEAPAGPAPDEAADEPAEAYSMPNAGPLAVALSSTGDDAATDNVAEAAEDAPVAATAAVAANPATTETQLGAEQQLLAACQAAEHWLQAELDSPGKTRPDEILRVLRVAAGLEAQVGHEDPCAEEHARRAELAGLRGSGAGSGQPAS